jgi:hypothetical protein
MALDLQVNAPATKPVSRRWKPGEIRSLNGDERISFAVASLYLFIFCAISYLYWPSLPMKILGGTAGVMGAMLSIAAIFNKGSAPRKHSVYTRTWYLVAFLSGLLTVFLLREAVRIIGNHVIVAGIIYGSLFLLLAIFRKAVVQIMMALVALAFISVTATNWQAARAGDLTFLGALEKCGQSIFKIQQIEALANTLIAGSYMDYLNKVDYLDNQLNMLAVRTVLDSKDDELQKTKAILDFVSNDIRYISDPDDGVEHARDPISTIIAGGGDCEDKTLVLCSMLESVGVKTYMAFTDDHVFALVGFSRKYPELQNVPAYEIEGRPCYVIDAADPGAVIGDSATAPARTKRIFDVRRKALVHFTPPKEG